MENGDTKNGQSNTPGDLFLGRLRKLKQEKKEAKPAAVQQNPASNKKRAFGDTGNRLVEQNKSSGLRKE